MSFARAIALALVLVSRLAAQLPPEVQTDLYLLEARKAVEQQDFDGARKALERLYSLGVMPGLAHTEAFYFQIAQVARRAGYNARAVQFATRYLETFGREGEHYSDALELLAAAQAETFHSGRMCEGKSVGSSCWLKLSSHPSCYVWNSSLQEAKNDSWSGECQDGLAQGEGTLTGEAVGDKMETTGYMVDGKRQGRWTVRHANGAVLEGPYLDGKRHGRWTVRSLDGIVAEVPYVDGKQRGQWTILSANGDVLEGPYVDGKWQGQWTLRFANGAIHEGPYINGKKQGRWVLRYAEGDVHEGLYVDGKRHGQWVLRHADGGIHEGRYVDGKMHGRWTLRYANGDVSEGPYVDDKRHGQWTISIGGQITNRIKYKQGVPE